MPGLLNSLESDEIWSKNCDEITVDRLQKFWSELPLQARQELLKIDKQALFEQARKNYYCSRCNGLLLGSFSQFAMHAKSLHQEGAGFHHPNRIGSASNANFGSELDDIQDPSVHPWGGLTATRDGMLTLLDCFIKARSLKALQKVFDSARTRGRERELMYPAACGGGDRGWNRGHGTRELCGLHTARVSFDTLVDFWSALGEETRTSLLRMKEEDFIERLTYRFDSKRFCQDCRRNVIREFKELKELKRLRRELQCTSWFCVADTAFQCEVTEDTVLADWHQFFGDTIATYHHFEWAIGTGEGKSDILEFEDVGMNEKVQLNGLRLGGLTACFITLRAWKLDGRCIELCMKAHALKGKPCVHQQLVIADGFVTISKGESIRRLFEHAEEVEEEGDDDVMDKDGNEIHGDGYRPQNHAKSPELAREFLLDAATVIFKEQVEKAFREGTTRQSAHSGFVSLALKLLEERVHVACKDTVTLEKQIKLLEEEEKEKREEEERRERRRMKEREKKLRRKERIKGKVREKEREHKESDSLDVALPTSSNGSCTSSIHNDSSPIAVDSGGSVSDPGEIKDEHSSGGCIDTKNLKTDSLPHQCHIDENFSARENNSSFTLEESKSSRRKMKLNKWHGGDVHHDETDIMPTHFSRLFNGTHRPLRERFIRTNSRSCNPKFSDKYNHSSNRMRDRYDFQSCKYGHGCPIPENCVLPEGYISSNTFSKDFIHTKQVLEPMDARRKGIKSNTSSAVVSNQSEGIEFDKACNLSESDVSTTYDRSATNCDCCSKDDAMSPMSNGSSDNSSSCISEGGSSTQNVVSSSTSDSEDATPHSQGSDDDTTNGSGSFNPTMDEMRKSVQISDNMSFGFDTSLYHQHHILPTHYHTVHIPVLPSPSVGVYQSQSAVSWQASPNGIMSFPDPHHFIFTRNPLGYNLQKTPRSLDYGMKYNPIQTITLPLLNAEHHFPCQNNNREYIAKPKERIDNLSVADVAERQFSIRQIPCSCRSPSNRKNGRVQCNSRIHDDDNSSFSLFHFGGPVVGAAGFNVNSVSSIREESIGRAKPYTTGSKEETAMEEYSLFSACDGVRFSIF